ncbi:hypothetical protein [Azospirillum thermophilum]|uniref:hypothetical protein n=1 Tax=Azospirillum thermophilum TaxID=2202148 RepID=UPI00143D5505|nr:hypothetical protein [Azospirillum thermophilum]
MTVLDAGRDRVADISGSRLFLCEVLRLVASAQAGNPAVLGVGWKEKQHVQSLP